LSRRRASAGPNQATRSISGKRCRRSLRGGHSSSNSFDTAAAGSRSPSIAQAWTTLPPFGRSSGARAAAYRCRLARGGRSPPRSRGGRRRGDPPRRRARPLGSTSGPRRAGRRRARRWTSTPASGGNRRARHPSSGDPTAGRSHRRRGRSHRHRQSAEVTRWSGYSRMRRRRSDQFVPALRPAVRMCGTPTVGRN
jgi:hypothetical protein